MRYATFATLLLAMACAVCLADDAPPVRQAGDLVLAFEFDGTPPAPAQIQAIPAGCQGPLFNPELVVGKNGGVRDVLVQLFVAFGQRPPAPVPPLAGQPATPAPVMTNKNCEFVPHMLLVQVGQKITLVNADPVPHNMNIASTFQPLNPLLPPNAQMGVTLEKGERMPIRVTCNLHNFMSGWIVATDHPFVAASDANGKVVIKDLPPGTYTFRAWHEKWGYIQAPKQNGEPVAWQGGKFTAKVAAGQNNLGVFLIK